MREDRELDAIARWVGHQVQEWADDRPTRLSAADIIRRTRASRRGPAWLPGLVSAAALTLIVLVIFAVQWPGRSNGTSPPTASRTNAAVPATDATTVPTPGPSASASPSRPGPSGGPTSAANALGPVPPSPVVLPLGTALGIHPLTDSRTWLTGGSTGVKAVTITTGTGNAVRLAAAFIVRPGLANPAAVSFESVATPGAFVSVERGATTLRRPGTDAGTRAAATFVARQGLTGAGITLTLEADSTLFLRLQGGRLLAQRLDRSSAAASEASFTTGDPVGPRPGRYQVVNRNSRLPLGWDTTVPPAGAPVVQAAPTAAQPFVWNVRGGRDGWYVLSEPVSGLPLNIASPSTAHGGFGVLSRDGAGHDPQWRFVPADGGWKIQSRTSGFLLGVQFMVLTPGAPVLQWDDNGTADHVWDLVSAG